MLGFVITGLDIKDLGKDAFAQIRQAIPQHGVICIKNQQLSPADLVRFTEQMGEAVLLPEGLRFNNIEQSFPQIARVSNLRADGSLIQGHKAAEYWHNDGDFWQPGRNYIYNFLYSEIVPQTGGETGFADLRLAYESLPERLKKRLEKLQIRVSCSNIPDFKDAKPEEIQPDALHHICHLHPDTQRVGLYIGHALASIDGLETAESQSIIAELVAEIEKHQYIHRWEKGDLLIWDNTSVMHRSMGGYADSPRLLYRTQAFMQPLERLN